MPDLTGICGVSLLLECGLLHNNKYSEKFLNCKGTSYKEILLWKIE